MSILFLWTESQNYLTTAPSSNLSGGDGVIVGGVRRAEDVLPRPENVSVILVNWYPPAVRVQWMYNGTSRKEHTHLMAFQIIYHPVNSRFVYFIHSTLSTCRQWQLCVHSTFSKYWLSAQSTAKLGHPGDLSTHYFLPTWHFSPPLLVL